MYAASLYWINWHCRCVNNLVNFTLYRIAGVYLVAFNWIAAMPAGALQLPRLLLCYIWYGGEWNVRVAYARRWQDVQHLPNETANPQARICWLWFPQAFGVRLNICNAAVVSINKHLIWNKVSRGYTRVRLLPLLWHSNTIEIGYRFVCILFGIFLVNMPNI